MAIAVFGSLNMDLVAHTPHLPNPGETVMGTAFVTTPGGKGANQAVAAAKLGIPTQMVGRVGGDGFGQDLLAALGAAGVGSHLVHSDPTTHSGVALITVAATGENQIIGVFGANGRVDDTDVARLVTLLPQVQVLLLQLEVPLAAVRTAAQAARQAGVTVILDPAPVPPAEARAALAEIYPWVDILVPNEVEAGQLVGFAVGDRPSAEQAAIALQQQGVATVIVKLGAQGAWCQTPQDHFFTPAFAVAAVDTVAAGDAFAGGLAAALVAGQPMRTAVQWGCATGALATTRHGAQVAMPDRATVEAFLRTYGPMP
jgi:ribokinase